MGTRADFYIKKDEAMVWLGSVGWDGYPSDPDVQLAILEGDEEGYLSGIACIRGVRDDWTTPDDGWPWPWDNSATTDFAYLYDDGRVYVSCFGSPWATLEEFNEAQEKAEEIEGPHPAFPDMKDIKNITYGKRSGLIVIRGR